jgi:hypothetical protein
MTIELIEGAVVALSTYLQANISAKVTELNTRYGDDYDIVDPVTWYLGAIPHDVPAAPSVALVGMDFTPTDQRTASIDGLNHIDIVVFQDGDQLEARFRRLARFGVAMVELLKAGKSSMGYYFAQVAGPIALSEVMDTPQFLQAIVVPVQLGKMEEY